MVNAFCRAYRYLQVCRARTLKNQEERHWQKGSCHILRLLPFNLGKIRRCAEVIKITPQTDPTVRLPVVPYRIVTGSALAVWLPVAPLWKRMTAGESSTFSQTLHTIVGLGWLNASFSFGFYEFQTRFQVTDG